jgi:hypothetical protein
MEILFIVPMFLGFVLVAALAYMAFWGRRLRLPSQEYDTVSGWMPEVAHTLNADEREALQLLRQALPEAQIFAQLQLARILKVPVQHSYAEWLRRVGSHCVDLIVCDAHCKAVAVVEVRNKEHKSSSSNEKRLERAQRVLFAAGIPLQVWYKADFPSVPQAREQMMRFESVRLALVKWPSNATELGLAGPRASAWAESLNDNPISEAPFYIAQQALNPQMRSQSFAMPSTLPAKSAAKSSEGPPSTWFDDLEVEVARPSAPASKTSTRQVDLEIESGHS